MKRKSCRKALIITYAGDSDVTESVTKVVSAILSVVNGIADTSVEVDVGIGSHCSFRNSTIGEARNSNVVVWIEAGFDIFDTWTEAVVVVSYSMGSDSVERAEAIVDIVSEGKARTQNSMVGVVICSPRIEPLIV